MSTFSDQPRRDHPSRAARGGGVKTRSCPERARKIAEIILADPMVLRDFLRPNAKPKRARAGTKGGRPVEEIDQTQLYGITRKQADFHVSLILRVRQAAIAQHGSISKAEVALGMRYKALQGALRPDRVRIRSQRRILREAAVRLGVEAIL